MLPQRKKLPHDIPPWVPDGSRYFITINIAKRGANILTQNAIAQTLLASIHVYEDQQKWHVWAMVVMPDHVHIIASFSAAGIQPIISSWKGYQAKTHHIDWQAGFFEHRLRNDAEFTEKFWYVLHNPVRRHLVTDWNEWPYTFMRGDWADNNR